MLAPKWSPIAITTVCPTLLYRSEHTISTFNSDYMYLPDRKANIRLNCLLEGWTLWSRLKYTTSSPAAPGAHLSAHTNPSSFIWLEDAIPNAPKLQSYRVGSSTLLDLPCLQSQVEAYFDGFEEQACSGRAPTWCTPSSSRSKACHTHMWLSEWHPSRRPPAKLSTLSLRSSLLNLPTVWTSDIASSCNNTWCTDTRRRARKKWVAARSTFWSQSWSGPTCVHRRASICSLPPTNCRWCQCHASQPPPVDAWRVLH